jgi:hypothetical protein
LFAFLGSFTGALVVNVGKNKASNAGFGKRKGGFPANAACCLLTALC